MPSLYDVAHLVAWNGYAQDMIPYLGVDKAAWNNDEFWFPHVANQLYGERRKSRIHKICSNMTIYKDYKDRDKDQSHNLIDSIIDDSYSPVQRIKQLLAYGAKADSKDTEGHTPLHVCCRNGWGRHKEIAEILINAGTNINEANIYGCTPLYMAARNGHLDIVKLLLSKGASHISCSDNEYPIDKATEHGHLNIVKVLVKAGAIITDSTFYKAIYNDKISILKYLGTIRSAPADSISYALLHDKSSAISILARIGGDIDFIEDDRTLIEKAVFDTDKSLYELCKAGANMNRTAVANATPPIFLALLMSHLETVKTFCKYGVDVNILYDARHNGHLLTPIIYILDKVHNDSTYEIFMELLPLSDLTLADSDGVTPLEFAKNNGMTKYALAIGREALKRKKL